MTAKSQAMRAKGKLCTGFTLIELLVVVAMISLLLALLIPALSKARALTKQTVCTGRLNQLHLAWQSYLMDNNDHFYQLPNANMYYGGWRSKKGWWPRVLNPYVFGAGANAVTEQGAEAFCCPADRGGVPGLSSHVRVYRNHGTSYQTNLFLIGPPTNNIPYSKYTEELDNAIFAQLPNLTTDRVAGPSRLLLMGDYGWVNQWDPMDLGEDPDEEVKELAEWHGRIDCHNVVFLDGHAKYTRIQKGIYVADDYCVLPFQELRGVANDLQNQHRQK